MIIFRYWIELLFVTLEALLLATFFIEDAGFLSKNKTTATMQAILFQINIFFIYIIIKTNVNNIAREHAEHSHDNLLREVASTIPNVKNLTQEEFYITFRSEISRARHKVDISHLDSEPPQAGSPTDSETRKYFDDFVATVKNNKKIKFRRVERLSRKKWPWIQKLAKDLSGCDNFDLAVLTPEIQRRKLPHVSVQIVDNHLTFLVAVVEHVDLGSARDQQLTGERPTALWKEYYNELLWHQADVLVQDGEIDQAIEKTLQRQVEI